MRRRRRNCWRMLIQDCRNEDLDLSGGSPATPLGEVVSRLKFKPTADLNDSYEDGREAVQDKRYRQALVALRKAEALDPDYRSSDETPTVVELMATAEKGLGLTSRADDFERRGQEALASGDWKAVEAAAVGIDRLLGTKHERAEALRRSMAPGVEAEAALLEAIADGQIDSAAGYLSRLRILSPRNPRVPGFLEKISWVRREIKNVPAFLAELSRAYLLNSPDGCKPLIHDSSEALKKSLQEETEKFNEAGVRLTADRHEIRKIRFDVADASARVEVTREFQYRVGERGRPKEGKDTLTYLLAKSGEGWKLKGVGE